MTELAQRAVACRRWRWMPRMMDTTGRTFIEYADCGEAAWLWVADIRCEWLPVEDRLPDLRDPATLGCLLALVREAWGDPYVYAMRLNVRRQIWVVHVPSDQHNIHGEGATEAEALVAALEAAP